MVTVRGDKPEDLMKAMKRFKRIVKESGILQEYKDKQYFQKPSEKKRLRKQQGIRRWKRERQKLFNEIKGPWPLTETMKKRATNASTDWARKEKMAADFVFGEELTEAICVKMIQSLSDNKVDLSNKEFQKYLPFINETIKSYIMKTKGYTHPLQDFINAIMVNTTLDNSTTLNYNVLDIKIIKRILKDIYGKK